MKKYIKFIILGVIVGILANKMGMNPNKISWWVFVVLCNMFGSMFLIVVTSTEDE